MKDALRYLMWAGTLLSHMLGHVKEGSAAALRLVRADMMLSGGISALREGASPILLNGYIRNAQNLLETCWGFDVLRPDLLKLKAALQLAAGDNLTIDTRSIVESLRHEMVRAEAESQARVASPVLMRGLAHG